MRSSSTAIASIAAAALVLSAAPVADGFNSSALLMGPNRRVLMQELESIMGVSSHEVVNMRMLHDWYSKRAAPLTQQQQSAGKNVVRVEQQEIIREMRCPMNMILIGDKCVGRELCPPKTTCPIGTVEDPMSGGTECISSVVPTETCPAGTSSGRNGRCSKCDVFPAEFECSSAEGGSVAAVLDSDRNACVSTMEVPPVCPAGFTNEGAACVQKLRSRRQCPAGFILDGRTKDCTKKSLTAAVPTCPAGAVEHPQYKCVNVRQDPPRCPRGYEYEAAVDECVKPVCEVPSGCPDGYNANGNDCIAITKTPAEEFCPNGFSMDVNGACVKEIPTPPRCPEHMTFAKDSGDSICEKIVKEIPRCPNGSTPIGHLCQNITQLDMTQCCPDGYTAEQGSCVKYLETSPSLSCQGECYTVKTLPVSHACPEGTEFDINSSPPRCVQSTIDNICDLAPPSHLTVVSNSPRCMQHMQKSQSELRAMYEQSPECFLPPASTPPPCQQVKKEKEIIAQPYCASGGELENGVCILRQPVIPEKICKEGQLDPHTEQCVQVLHAPMESKCPPNTTREGYKCIMKETVQPEFVCPDDSDSGPNGCCVVRTASIASAPTVTRAQVQARCSSGKLSSHDNTCVETHTAPKLMACPRNSIRNDSGACVVTTPLVVPKPIETPADPIYVCSSGVVQGSSCHVTDTLPSALVCPDGAYLDADEQCTRHEQLQYLPPKEILSIPNPVCPAGAQRRGTSCVSTTETEAQKSCPFGFSLESDGRCIKRHEVRKICPAGMSLTAEGCTRELVAPPTVEIIKGCMHDVTPVCEGCPKEIVTTCSSGKY